MRVVELHHISGCIVTLKLLLVGALIFKMWHHTFDFSLLLNEEFVLFMIAGAVAQLIDGTLGMAYGVSCSSLLMAFGVSPVIASASVHTAEVFTTGISGLSHIYFGNVDRALFFRLALPGVTGATLGAYLLSTVFDGGALRPYIFTYLMVMGFLILKKSCGSLSESKKLKHISLLGFFAAFCDAIGGGGWGPIATSNIIQQGHPPKETVGTVNTVEFFVAFFGTGVFLYFVGVSSWPVIFGLIAGGITAAPVAAAATGTIPPRIAMRLVGTTVIAVSLFNLYRVWRG